MLDGDLRHGAIHERQHRLFDDDVQPHLLVADQLHLSRDWRNYGVGKENTRERTNKGRGDECAENFWRLIYRAHGFYDAENSCHNSKRRETISHYHEGVLRLHLVVPDSINFFVHQGFNLVRTRISHHYKSKVVADERRQIFVGQNRWRGFEDIRFFRIVDDGFHVRARTVAQLAHHEKQQCQQFNVLGMFGNAIFESFANSRAAVLDRLHRVGDDERSERSAADNDVFPGLPNDANMAAHGREAAEHTDHGDDEAGKNCHNNAPSGRGDPASRVRRFGLRGTGFQGLKSVAAMATGRANIRVTGHDVSQPQGKPAIFGSRSDDFRDPAATEARTVLTAAAAYRGVARDLTRSLDNIAKSPQVARETTYYRENIGKVKSIDDFMADKRLLNYALNAFGLSDVAYAGALIRRVLEGGTDNSDALANKLVDQRYREFAGAFNFVRYGSATTSFDATQSGTVERYKRQVLEQNTGQVSEGARLALYFERQAPNVKSALGLLADRALLSVTQTALGMSPATSNLSIEAQQKLIEEKLDVADLKDRTKLDKFLTKFMARWDAANVASNSNGFTGIATTSVGTVNISTDILAALQKIQRSF